MTIDLEPVNLLVFGAHPDDSEIGCGGTILSEVGRGTRVGMIDLTRGEMGTRGTVEQRAAEAQDAAKLLGVAFREVLDFGDGNLRSGRDEEIELIRRIRATRPDVVIAPWPDDRHPDHTRCGRLVTDAWFYSGLRKIDTGQEPHRPDAIVYYIQNYVQHPSFVVDVTETFERKMSAMLAHRSQFHDPQSNEPETFISKKSFLELIEARARHFGVMIGAEFGEGFVSRQPPAIADIAAAYRGREL